MTNVVREETDSSSASVSTESRAEVVYIVTAIITLSSLIVFALRLFIRCVLLKTAGPDDWTMLIAQMFAVVAGIATFIGTYYILICSEGDPSAFPISQVDSRRDCQ